MVLTGGKQNDVMIGALAGGGSSLIRTEAGHPCARVREKYFLVQSDTDTDHARIRANGSTCLMCTIVLRTRTRTRVTCILIFSI